MLTVNVVGSMVVWVSFGGSVNELVVCGYFEPGSRWGEVRGGGGDPFSSGGGGQVLFNKIEI